MSKKTRKTPSINDIKIREISKKEIEENQKKSKQKMIIQYLLPLALLVIIGIIYIPTHINILLIPFGILMLIVMFGWDGSTRTCPKCKKWNAVIWTKEETIRVTKTKKKKVSLKKSKEVQISTKIKKQEGKCKNCGHTFEIEKNTLI